MSLRHKIILVILFSLVSLPVFADRLIVEPDSGRQPILNTISQARASLDLAIYGFTDEELLQGLISAKNSNKQIRLLLQHFPYQTPEENLPAIQKLSAAHIAYNFSPPDFYFFHQKTLLIDQRLALIMTFNFTRPTFKNQRNFGLLISDPLMVKEIQNVFNADWQGGRFTPQQPNLIWSPDNSRQKIIELIHDAKSSIQIYAQGLSDHQVIGALANAAHHGVQIRILTSGSPPGKKWVFLQKAGVQFRIGNKNIIHAKVIIIDAKKAMLGSINFTKASINMNRELSIITYESKIIAELLNTFQSDWEQATMFKQLPSEASRVSHQSQSYS